MRNKAYRKINENKKAFKFFVSHPDNWENFQSKDLTKSVKKKKKTEFSEETFQILKNKFSADERNETHLKSYFRLRKEESFERKVRKVKC